jgi:hypothetical protein
MALSTRDSFVIICFGKRVWVLTFVLLTFHNITFSGKIHFPNCARDGEEPVDVGMQ